MKKLLYILLGLVMLVVVAIGVLVAVINPNDFKPLIADEVKKATGRELVIDGDISWRFWPSLGLSVEKLAFKNPQGFAEPNMLKLDRADLSVAVMPLMSDTLDIGLVSLYGAHVFIQTLPNGQSNLDGLTGDASTTDSEPETASQTPTTEPASDSQAATAWTITIGGLDVVNASAVVRDDKVHTISEISQLNLHIGKLTTGTWVPVEFDVEGKQNAMVFTAKGQMEAMLNKVAMESQLRKLSLSASLNDANIQLDSLSLTADQVALAMPAALTFSAKGKANDMSFDTSGKASVLVDKSIANIQATGIDISTLLAGASLPRPEMNISLKADAAFNNNTQKLTLSQLVASLDELEVDGHASVALADIPAVRFALHSSKIDLDAFLGNTTEAAQPAVSKPAETKPSSAPNDQSATAIAKAPLSDVEPDLSALKGLDIAGEIAIDELVANNVKVSQVKTAFAVNRGKVNLKQFDAKLYGGSVSAEGSLDATVTPARYRVTKDIKNVNVQPLLMAAANEDILSGRGSIDVNVNGVGLSEKRLRTGITGTVAINFADGSIDGINIPEMIREAKATLKGKRADYVEEARQTDFSALTATFNLGKGIASTRNMKMEAPALRIRSEGQTNLVSEDLDFEVFVSVVGTSKGQGGKDIDELKDVTIPVAIGGTWQAPSYKLDVKALLTSNKVLEEKVRKEAERGLEKLLGDKAGDDKVKNVADKLLKGLFN
ncbi:AsmA family protein [Enterovibrio sp. ZSDZ42]|uniref:AsmA family protein n=1 Tax=Enterovibrio gelatinilyticus TaxID=2899819 RepID=A0ABT5R3R0_9GAMM|nr:AsmA family protein [Enterovibrio sp. ZSDZ42]MDD1794908.1 AsmA family protein [Enterovibrio sp. ZSDZ42]